ncbi:hypothetical protein BGW38_009186 [Lunasporangiospora selenospora]|uniref:Uncharacterized protein n=1 Tax=Lunasporangiospora selenospora TaxID=979761 RepID=A0A9P6K8R5_9FUNG|nr:hypothetical protein BGW38_009186 [Lunasporangiospora selenospora]
MSHQQEDDDFSPSNTNYKPGEKKSFNEYQNLDANDDSLRRWKESLGVKSGDAPAPDTPNVHVLQFILEVEGRPDVILDLTKSCKEWEKA